MAMSSVSTTRRRLAQGLVIPAHPLALTAGRRLAAPRRPPLPRYSLDAGAGGLAVGVHPTQFAIRNPAVGLYRPVLELAAETAAGWRKDVGPILIARGIGTTRQA